MANQTTRLRLAALALIERADRKILAVWNKRYRAWTLPGGKVEEGESIEDTVAREVPEETSLLVERMARVYDSGLDHDPLERSSYIHVVRVKAVGVPRETEDGCPVTWLTRDEFLNYTPFYLNTARIFSCVRSALDLGDGGGSGGWTMPAPVAPIDAEFAK